MSTKNLVTEDEAVTLAGVSARTLLRFSESGYLTVETDITGTRWFSRAQLEEIFGATTVSSSDGTSPTEESATEGKDSEAQLRGLPAEEVEPGTSQDTQSSGIIGEEASVITPATNLELEIQRLQNLLSMQERILDLKDDEIADLKNQRSWLRERVEKLEEKSDRDQILLLSETQTIRRLISYQESRKSPVKQLLEWIGLSRANDVTSLTAPSDFSQGHSSGTSSRTIEVRTAANSQ